MKFRKLTLSELQPLESDMISFLALNGITGEDWRKIQNTENERSQQWIDSFSEMVWLKIFSSKRYINIMARHCNYYYDFLPQEINVVKFENSEIGKGNTIGFQNLPFAKSREEDMFDLMENGGEFSDGKEYKEACLLWASAKK